MVAAPKDDVDARCGGEPLLPITEQRDEAKSPAAPHDAGTQMGKRYVNEAGDLELLVSKNGDGSLSVGDVPMRQQLLLARASWRICPKPASGLLP